MKIKQDSKPAQFEDGIIFTRLGGKIEISEWCGGHDTIEIYDSENNEIARINIR